MQQATARHLLLRKPMLQHSVMLPGCCAAVRDVAPCFWAVMALMQLLQVHSCSSQLTLDQVSLVCAGAADVAELLDTDAVSAASTNRLAPPPAGFSGRAAGHNPAKPPTLTQKPVLGGKPAAAAPAAEWAVRGGVRDLDAEFERLRPNLAYRFPFELDRFQKEAVVHLEQVRKTTLQ